jgi:hypothetical protein
VEDEEEQEQKYEDEDDSDEEGDKSEDEIEDGSDSDTLIATGRSLAPNAKRIFRLHQQVYAWYDDIKLVVTGKIVKMAPINSGGDKWARNYEVDFKKNSGDGIFDMNFGDLFTNENDCNEAYHNYK